MKRVLRHGASTYGSLQKANGDHAFASSSAMMIYPSSAIYTMIPKNACSTLRLSIALENGAIRDPSEHRWIHKNNDAFRPSLSEIFTARYSFVILRCPFSRLVSLFLDKFVSRDPVAWHFKEIVPSDPDLASLTFRAFCTQLGTKAVLTANKHWRPQVDFLLYDHYDGVFCVEDFAGCAAALRQHIGLEVVDSRQYVRHDSSRHQVVGGLRDCYADEEAWKIETLFRVGLRPRYDTFYDDELIDLVSSIYAEDLALFRSRFPQHGMFGDPLSTGVPTRTSKVA